MTKAENWCAVKPGWQLDRLIAEKRGWKAYQENGQFGIAFRDHRYCNPIFSSADEAWDYAFAQNWILPVGTSLDTAWTLFAELPDNLTPRLVRMFRNYKAGILHNETYIETVGEAPTPALSICYSWLMWLEHKDD